MTHWKKPIRNDGQYTWLDRINQGLKRYEGRLYHKDWVNVEVGDTIEFYTNNQISLNVKIIGLERYKDFGEAFDNCGTELVPIEGITREEVIKIYCDIFKKMEEEIKKIGVVAVKVQKL